MRATEAPFVDAAGGARSWRIQPIYQVFYAPDVLLHNSNISY
jgi:hypothetical protein